MEFGETPEDALVREVFEETQLRAIPGRILDVTSTIIEEDGEELHVVRVIYQASVESGELKHEVDGSTDQAAWFRVEQAAELPLTLLAKRGLKLAVQLLEVD